MPKTKLIKLKKEHFALFNKWWNDPELRHYTSQSKRKVSEKEITKTLNSHFKNPNIHDFIIEYDKKPIGHIVVQQKPKRKSYELYVAIGEKSFWNKGIGTEAIKLMTQWFFKHFLSQPFLELEVNQDNSRAIRVYEKIGFQKIKSKHYKNHPDTYLMRKDREAITTL